MGAYRESPPLVYSIIFQPTTCSSSTGHTRLSLKCKRCTMETVHVSKPSSILVSAYLLLMITVLYASMSLSEESIRLSMCRQRPEWGNTGSRRESDGASDSPYGTPRPHVETALPPDRSTIV